jgi:hypothetical protein
LLVAGCRGSHAGAVDASAGTPASAQDHPYAIAIDDTNVYWTTIGTSGTISATAK